MRELRKPFPRKVEDPARHLVNRPRPRALDHTDELFPPMFGVRFGVDTLNLEESGWGVVFHEDGRMTARESRPGTSIRRSFPTTCSWWASLEIAVIAEKCK